MAVAGVQNPSPDCSEGRAVPGEKVSVENSGPQLGNYLEVSVRGRKLEREDTASAGGGSRALLGLCARVDSSCMLKCRDNSVSLAAHCSCGIWNNDNCHVSSLSKGVIAKLAVK